MKEDLRQKKEERLNDDSNRSIQFIHSLFSRITSKSVYYGHNSKGPRDTCFLSIESCTTYCTRVV